VAFRTPLIGQRIGLGFAIALAASVAIGIFSLRNLNEMQRETALVSHTLEVLSEVRLLNDSVSRFESASRGYLLSGDENLRVDFSAQLETARASLRKLQVLTIDNASQQVRLDRLETILNRRAAAAQETVSMRDKGDAGSAKRVAAMITEGQAISENFRALSKSVAGEESRLLGLRHEASQRATTVTRGTVVYGSLSAFILVTVSGFFLTRGVTVPLSNLRKSAARIGKGDYSHRASVATDDEVGLLGQVFNEMAEQVERRQATLADQDWLKTGLAKFSASFQRQRDPVAISNMVLGELAGLLGAQHSVLYRFIEDEQGASFRLCASYAAENPPPRLALGEGLVGQCGAEKRRILLAEIPPDYLRISSGLGGARPGTIVLQPVEFEGRIKAVLELASLRPFTDLQLEFVERLAASLGIVFQNLEATAQTEELLRKSQALTARLEAQQRVLEEQQVELTQTNEELEQTNEEMEQTNEEMEEKTNLLANQKRELENSNRLIEEARGELQEQARQLTISSTYKSNFLATMSHELRTPLNSLLILARLLAENSEANLTAKQVQFAKTIESSGGDLLEMINQILDLAKIESGTAELQLDEVTPADLQRSVEQLFRHVADTKRLEFGVDVDPGLPDRIRTDVGRLHQVIKNLLANAFKFTERGSVRVEFRVAKGGWTRSSASLNAARSVIAISVADTGIGIPRDKQEIIFESFQQADAGTARRFGGTGLGLSISRELATMLGGVLQLESDTGKGSTFTLFIPAMLDRDAATHEAPASAKHASPAPAQASATAQDERAADPPDIDEPDTNDDRGNIVPGDRVLLIIEDDLKFAGILVDFAREKRFKALVARGSRRALALAQRFSPAAITLDIRLVDEDGWLVLDRLKHDHRTRHIPVHVISVEAARSRGLRQGAVSFLQKPVTREAIGEILQQTIAFIERRVKNLLVVEDDTVQRQAIQELIGNNDVHTTAVATAAEALSALEEASYDCIVMDLMLPDQAGADLIREINRRHGLHAPPVIVYTGKELSPREETELRSLSESIIVKDARSPERLLDETALFLHRVQARLPESKRRMLEQVRRQDAVLTGRRVLIVDDDARNIFALTAVLEGYGMIVQFAESGAAAIEMLKGESSFDVVLMDVMMPEMDGNEAIRRLRAEDRFAKLPIIAVTAKAMKGDRERSIESGASDYVTKPVDTDKLVSLLRVWLYR
jgi:CheY-like chemotaxis protein/signal transduction histidine kinase/CHASE3 domain sensor protein